MRAKKNFFILWFLVFFLFSPFSLCAKGIVLKLMGVNPSEKEKQKVTLKAYLPREVTPEDITDLDGLEVIYDTKEGAYYVYGEFEVAPKGVIEREVELKDVWLIPEEELESLRKEAAKTTELLKDTEFKERAEFLKESIESKLHEITQKQAMPAVKPQAHVSSYRNNLQLLESVKADLVLARSLLAQAKGLPTASVWKVFLVIVSFLGIFALALYFIWQKQVKAVSPALEAKPQGEDAGRPQEWQSGEKKDAKIEDIEKIIKEGDR